MSICSASDGLCCDTDSTVSLVSRASRFDERGPGAANRNGEHRGRQTRGDQDLFDNAYGSSASTTELGPEAPLAGGANGAPRFAPQAPPPCQSFLAPSTKRGCSRQDPLTKASGGGRRKTGTRPRFAPQSGRSPSGACYAFPSPGPPKNPC